MEFNFSKFENLLETRDHSKNGYKDKTGFYKVASIIWDHYTIDYVDFEDFTYADVMELLSDIENMFIAPAMTFDGEESDEVYIMNPNCAFLITNNNEELIDRFFKSKNKKFIEVKDCIFI